MRAMNDEDLADHHCKFVASVLDRMGYGFDKEKFKIFILDWLQQIVGGRMMELKPCPFCGGKAKYIYQLPFNVVQCQKCRAYGKTICDLFEQQDMKDRAIEEWNRRVDNANL